MINGFIFVHNQLPAITVLEDGKFQAARRIRRSAEETLRLNEAVAIEVDWVEGEESILYKLEEKMRLTYDRPVEELIGEQGLDELFQKTLQDIRVSAEA